jgi:hypothetical protein
LGCTNTDISTAVKEFKVPPRIPRLMGRKMKPRRQPVEPESQTTATRANAALQAAATAPPRLHPYTSVQRLTAEYLGQMQGLLHNELVRVTITKDTAGQVELTYDLVERHRQKWP